jgi:hypothetical protein
MFVRLHLHLGILRVRWLLHYCLPRLRFLPVTQTPQSELVQGYLHSLRRLVNCSKKRYPPQPVLRLL